MPDSCRAYELGWSVGRNVRLDYRFTLGDAERTRRYEGELVALAPDVVLSVGAAATAAMQQATRTVPTVFVLLPDPVGAGLVDSLARPGGNATGFTLYEFGLSAKWWPCACVPAVLLNLQPRPVGSWAGLV